MKKNDLFDSLVVVKRSGQRCLFQGEKIAIAIKKAFDSVGEISDIKCVNEVYKETLKRIETEYQDRKTIKIEDIQDMIENVLNEKKYLEIYASFKNYRERRHQTRETFQNKEQHKFLKVMEKLGLLESDDTNFMGEKLPPQKMFHNFGSVISKEFAYSYLLDHKMVRNLDSGVLFCHHLEYYPMGNPYSVQLEFSKFLRVEEKRSITDTMLNLSHLIQSIFDEQCGSISIPNFETELASFSMNHFVGIWRETLLLKLSSFGLQGILPMDLFYEKIKNLKSLSISLDEFSFFYQDSKPMEHLFVDSYRESLEVLQDNLKEAFHWFLEEMEFHYKRNMKKQVLSLNFGTDFSFAGMMISKILLLSLNEFHTESVQGIFKVKHDLHLDKKGSLHELFTIAKSSYLDSSIAFSFLSTQYNQKGVEVCYGPEGERVFDDNTTLDSTMTSGKGSLSFVSINLPRIALHHSSDDVLSFFCEELKDVLETAKNEILERFEYQCGKHNYNFPTLIKKGIWMSGEQVKETDRLRKIWKHGALQISFVGLFEAIQILVKDSKNIYEEALYCVRFMRELLDAYSIEHNLNFVLCGLTLEDVNCSFYSLDQVIYGNIKTVEDSYSKSFHFPKYKSIREQIEMEGAFHALCNGGHDLVLRSIPKEPLEDVLEYMEACGIGYTTFKKVN